MHEGVRSVRPLVWTTLRPVGGDCERLRRALAELSEEDAGFRVDENDVDGQVIIRATDEVHLETICERLAREHRVYVDAGEPEVIYLETIRDTSAAEGKLINQSGGRGHYAHVAIRVEPNPTRGYEFVNAVAEGAIPQKYVGPVDRGIQHALKAGVSGHEVVDIKVTLGEGSYHDIDSDEEAFESAGFVAMTEAMRQANPVLLEPLMSLEVVVPEEWAGSIMGDLNLRGADVTGMESSGGEQMSIHATVRLAAIIGYATDLRSMTQERATCSMGLLRYAEAQGLPSDGDDRIGVTANNPRKPKPKHGAEAVEPPWPEINS